MSHITLLIEPLLPVRLDFNKLAILDAVSALRRLRQLRGVARWMTEYVLLRGLWRLQLFPDDDLGARNNSRRWQSLRDPLDYAGVVCTFADWRRSARHIYPNLMLESLAAKGPRL